MVGGIFYLVSLKNYYKLSLKNYYKSVFKQYFVLLFYLYLRSCDCLKYEDGYL